MKKFELSDLIERKKILKESLEIINETRMEMDEYGGFDSPEVMGQYHGNYFDELTKTFFHFDNLSNELIDGMKKIMDDEERRKSQLILYNYYLFMDEYLNFLIELREKVKRLSPKNKDKRSPDTNNLD